MKQAKKLSDSKSFQEHRVWWYVRFGFWTMIGSFIINMVLSYFTGTSSPLRIIGLIVEAVFYISTIFVFVNAIRHLVRYEEKPFAVTAVVFSALFLLALFVIVIVGIMLSQTGAV